MHDNSCTKHSLRKQFCRKTGSIPSAVHCSGPSGPCGSCRCRCVNRSCWRAVHDHAHSLQNRPRRESCRVQSAVHLGGPAGPCGGCCFCCAYCCRWRRYESARAGPARHLRQPASPAALGSLAGPARSRPGLRATADACRRRCTPAPERGAGGRRAANDSMGRFRPRCRSRSGPPVRCQCNLGASGTTGSTRSPPFGFELRSPTRG